MDERGYNTFWMAEHHFQPEGTELIPNLLMMAMHLCGVTKNLRIGCGFNVVPMWHPLRLAEDYAMAEILTGGRVIFGVARGYHTREVESFGAPLIDQDANREMFEEGVDILFKAFEGKPFSHKGKFYTIPPEVPYRGYTLPEARRDHQVAAHRRRGEGRRLPCRHPSRHHRAAEGGREALSRHRPGDLRHAARHPARRPAGRPRLVRHGGHAGVPQRNRRGGSPIGPINVIRSR